MDDNTTTGYLPPASTIPTPVSPPLPLSSTPTPKPTLQSLPLDLLFHLSSLLDYPSLLALSSTSRALRSAINPELLCPLPQKIEFYLRAEHFPQHEERLACFGCWRLLGKDRFGDSKRRGRFGKNSPRDTGAGISIGTGTGRGGGSRGGKAGRFCWECGVQGRKYEHLRRVKKDGVGYYPCHRCGVARVGSERCLREGCVVRGMEGVGGESGLERLPVDVQRRVFGLLGYADLIALKQVSRRLRGVVDPVAQWRDVYGMWAFVMARMKAMGRLTTWWSGPRACFGCFRVRPERHFSSEQYALSYSTRGREYWRRRCWECLRRFYHPRLADVEARARFHRQEICGVCKCMRYCDEDCRGCVVRKDEIAEWARRKREKMANRGKPFDIWQETGKFIPSQWFSEDSGAVNEGSESDTDDVWDDGIGPCLKTLELGDEAFPSEHIVSDSEPCSVDPDDFRESST